MLIRFHMILVADNGVHHPYTSLSNHQEMAQKVCAKHMTDKTGRRVSAIALLGFEIPGVGYVNVQPD